MSTFNLNNIKLLIKRFWKKMLVFFQSDKFRRSLVFFFFLFLAFGFRVLQSMGEDYTYTYNIPITFKNIPEDAVVTNDLPSSIQVTIAAKGSTMFKYSYGKSFSAIEIDVTTMQKTKKEYIVTSENIKTEIRKQLLKGTGLSNIIPDNIHIYYALEENKEIPVRIDFHITTANQCMQSGDAISDPAFIKVYAPKSVLDTLNEATTILFEGKDLKDTVHKKIALRKITGVKFVPDKVDILIPIEEFTEKTIEIPIQGINVPKNFTLRIFPAKVNVSFFVVLSKFNSITAKDFQATIDYTETGKDGNGKLKINLSKFPTDAQNIRLSTSEADILLEEKTPEQ